MPGRSYTNGSGYRYGFNGKENDNEVKGSGKQQDYGMRIYDPRIGKFLSVDPVTNKYPELTPYQFASNRPIDGIDLDGLEWKKFIPYVISPALAISSDKEIMRGFTLRAKEAIHGMKNLPKVIQAYLETQTTSLPGGAHVKQQEERRKSIETAVGQGGVEYVKEMYSLVRKASEGDKQAIGALLFEAAMFVVPEAEIGRAFSASGKFGKLLSVDSRATITSVGRFKWAEKEIAIQTKGGTRGEAIQIAKEITGGLPSDAVPMYGKQGILTDKLVGYKWYDKNGQFKSIRLDHDLNIGTHLNFTSGKDKFAIPINLTEDQAKRIGTNEIMKEIKKANK